MLLKILQTQFLIGYLPTNPQHTANIWAAHIQKPKTKVKIYYDKAIR